ncbi:MAG TPA: FUSC family protein [Acetobacteraceae bacterium]|nr:FUSC family protein [Acetobacteraceae bacterium]
MPDHDQPLRLTNLVAVDGRKLLFSISNFLAAAATLVIAFEASLPRPWWALLTVYVTAQPMSGAFRPKMLYRFGGIAIGAVVTIALVPNLQNSPILLVFCLAIWTGFCIYLAVLDRTPRAFLFQMAAFSAAVMSFPYLDDPGDIFTTTVSRVEEMTVAILCVTASHMLLQPWSVRPIIRERARAFLSHASTWTSEALGTHHTRLEYAHRRRLATDVVELGLMAIHLPFDQRLALATRDTVLEIQHRLAAVLSIASATADRLDRLRVSDGVDAEIAEIVATLVAWLKDTDPRPDTSAATLLIARCRAAMDDRTQRDDWTSLLTASLCDRIAALVQALDEARQLVASFDGGEPRANIVDVRAASRFVLARDHGLAALAGAATATAICLYCAIWILLAWPTGSSTAAFAAIITCSFAAQDDPAPAIGRYLMATLSTFPLAALYLFVILPRADGIGMLILTLAPTFIWMGYIQADPARSAKALPMFSAFIATTSFVDRFQADFAQFTNTSLAQVAGIATTLAVTRLFRSTSIRWTAYRIIRRNWRDLHNLADRREPLSSETWTARAVDRLGQVAARMADADPGDTLHAADGLVDLRVGRNIIQVRRGIQRASERAQLAISPVLDGIAALFRSRLRSGLPVPADRKLLSAIDDAIRVGTDRASDMDAQSLLSLVGMRCNLFPTALPYGATG